MHKKGEAISQLKNLALHQVEALDREATGGKGLAYYENALISHPAVYHNHISGRVGNYLENYDVRITFHENEIAGSCPCQRSHKICKHIVALLYSWVNDSDEFLDIQTVLQHVHTMKKGELVEIVENILRQNPEFADLFLHKQPLDWDEIDPSITNMD